MTKEEYQNYLDDCKAKLTERDRISLAKEYNKLPKSYKYWNKRRNNIICCSDADYIFGKYCDKRISYIAQRMEELEYILDIPEEYTFNYRLFHDKL
jgi:hypothetical protein